MNKFRFAMMALAIMAFTLIVSSGAQAQATRTWVSGVGDDVNPCSRTAPCKTRLTRRTTRTRASLKSSPWT